MPEIRVTFGHRIPAWRRSLQAYRANASGRFRRLHLAIAWTCDWALVLLEALNVVLVLGLFALFVLWQVLFGFFMGWMVFA